MSALSCPAQVKEMGFWGAKVPLPFSPSEGHIGMQKNIDFLQKHRDSVGPGSVHVCSSSKSSAVSACS